MRSTVSLAEVAAGLAAKINAASTGFTASVNGNTLVITNAGLPGFAASARVSTPAGAASGDRLDQPLQRLADGHPPDARQHGGRCADR